MKDVTSDKNSISVPDSERITETLKGKCAERSRSIALRRTDFK
jgi:hypothetical protein